MIDMSILIKQRNNILVVDSRLIAEELGIKHKTFKETIIEYREKLELLAENYSDPVAISSSNRLLKETTPKKSDGTGGEVYYLLTESQTYFLITLSVNKDQVVKAKHQLILEFNKAKKMFNNVIDQNVILDSLLKTMQAMQVSLNKQREELAQIKETSKILPTFLKAGQQHPGCKSVIESSMKETDNNPSVCFSVMDYLTSKGIHLKRSDYIKTYRRAAPFYCLGKEEQKPKVIRRRNVYCGNDIIYIEQALRSVLGF
jgi:phage regulator Rha-like protein